MLNAPSAICVARVDGQREIGDRLVARVAERELEVGRLGKPLLRRELGDRHLDRVVGLLLVFVLAGLRAAAGDEHGGQHRGK